MFCCLLQPEVAEKLGMGSLKWEDIFAGPTPAFSTQSPKIKKVSVVDGAVEFDCSETHHACVHDASYFTNTFTFIVMC